MADAGEQNPIAQTFDPRNPDANRRGLHDPRTLLRPHSITPDLLAPAVFPDTTPGTSPAFNDDASKQATENGSAPTAARSDHSHDLTYVRDGQARSVGTADADYADPYGTISDGIDPPEDDVQRRVASWSFDPAYAVTPGPTLIYASFSLDSGVTWSEYFLVGVAPPTIEQVKYVADRKWDFSVSTTQVRYIAQNPKHDRGVALKLVRTDSDGKIDPDFLPTSLKPLVYIDDTAPGANDVANTANETAFDSDYEFAANTLVVGQRIRLLLRGTFNTALVGPTFRLKVYWGTTAILDSGGSITLGAFVVNLGWQLTVDIGILSIGVAGTMQAGGMLFLDGLLPTSLPGASAITIDTTAAKILVAKVQFGTADPSNRIYLRQMDVEVLVVP